MSKYEASGKFIKKKFVLAKLLLSVRKTYSKTFANTYRSIL